MRRNVNSEEKPTTPRLPSGAGWGTRLLIFGLVIGLFIVTLSLPFGSTPGFSPNVQVANSGARTSSLSHSSRTTHGPTALTATHSVWSSLSGYLSNALLPQVSATRPSIDSLASQSGLSKNAAGQQTTKANGNGDYSFGGSEDKEKTLAAKVAPDLQGADPNASVDVIVQFKQTPGTAQLEGVRAEGAEEKGELRLINAAVFSVHGSAIQALAGHPEVAYISPNRPVTRSLDHVAKAVNADIAWSHGWDGTGIGVAVIDSGIFQHADLYNDRGAATSRLVYSQSFVPGDPSTSDAYGHGTHVAGIIAGNAHDSLGYLAVLRGMAPEAQLINLRVLDQTGSGTDSAVIAAIQTAIQLKSVYNIRVINLSLGRPVYESYKLDPLCQAVEAAWQSGIVVVAAAGNSGRNNSLGTHGYGTIAAPANDPYVITVGATNMHGSFSQAVQTIASYSSKGPTLIDHIVKPDLVAPGNSVASLIDPGSTLATQLTRSSVFPCDTGGGVCTSGTGQPEYFRLSGTSMATPVVSGAAALLLQQNPQLTPDEVKARLMKTAWKGFGSYTNATDEVGNIYSLQHDIFAVGAGYLDIAAALSNTDLAPPTVGSAKSPQVAYDPIANTVYVVQDSSVIWGGSVLWGTGVVWGTSVLQGTTVSGSAVLWGSSVVWGTSTNQGFSVVWGTGVVWGTSTTQALAAGGEDVQ